MNRDKADPIQQPINQMKKAVNWCRQSLRAGSLMNRVYKLENAIKTKNVWNVAKRKKSFNGHRKTPIYRFESRNNYGFGQRLIESSRRHQLLLFIIPVIRPIEPIKAIKFNKTHFHFPFQGKNWSKFWLSQLFLRLWAKKCVQILVLRSKFVQILL